MLRSLHVRNYVLIDSLDISFPEGLIIITGQTGAGKSIILGAISLVTGAKADASVIASGKDNCVVEAEFDVSDETGEFRALLDENEVEWDGGHLVIRRVVHATGRSRSFVNDSPVQVGLLSAIASRLIDIHSQHQSLMLSNSAYQLSILDWFSGNSSLLSDCRNAWNSLQKVSSELEKAQKRLQELSAGREYDEAQFKELDEARLVSGELEALDEEQKQLANAESIKEDIARVRSLMEPEDERIPGVSVALKESQRILGHTSQYVGSLSELASRIESSRIEIEDILSELEDIDSGISLSSERLEQVEQRQTLLYDLLKKHGCRTIDELIEVREKYSDNLYDSSSLEERIDSLKEERTRLAVEYGKLSAALRKSRKEKAPAFASAIQDSIRFLELERAVFEVDVLPRQDGPDGSDTVLFRFSSVGGPAVDVARCASGGEISRIMLCLKAMMAHYVGMPTMIFDEIDTGVSGSAADKMGSMICRMGGEMQVFAITHLPQVAAKGNAHYVVSKSDDGTGRTVSVIRRVEGEDRVGEIARLLSGSAISEAAIANARVLLGE